MTQTAVHRILSNQKLFREDFGYDCCHYSELFALVVSVVPVLDPHRWRLVPLLCHIVAAFVLRAFHNDQRLLVYL